MSQTPNSKIAVIGIDIGKNSFHIVGQDQRGAIVLRQTWSRGQVESRLANLLPCLIGMEAARPHRLGGSPQGARFRVRQDQCDGAPTCLILAPCSSPSRRGLAMLKQAASLARRPALTAPARVASVHPQAGTKERPPGANKGTVRSREIIDDVANNPCPPRSARG